MTVSKRLRFEILRRDNHACRYCGRSAPEVKLTIDHVFPEALGGSDDPSNLVAACQDCNGGKSSSSPDASIVADVSNDAVRWAAAMRQAAEENQLNDNTEVYEAVVNAWTSFRRRRVIPDDYRETIDQFLTAGLPSSDIVQMVHVADAKYGISDSSRWRYFCGCCWTRIRQLQERASEIVRQSDLDPINPGLSTLWTEDEAREYVQTITSNVMALGLAIEDVPLWCPHEDRGHCGDLVCALMYATELAWYAVDWSTRRKRHNAIADESEALIDG